MLRSVKTATQIIAGSWVAVAILAAIGVAGYLLIEQFESNATSLVDQGLETTKHLGAVQRAAREALLEEDACLPAGKDAFGANAKKLAELAGRLDRLDTVAAQRDDSELAETTEDLRGLASQYGKRLAEGAAAFKQAEAAEQMMDDKSTLLGHETAACLAALRTKYLAAKRALAVVDRIHAMAVQMRLNDRELLSSKGQDALGAVQKSVAGLLTGYDELERLNPDAVERKQIDDARKAIRAHLACVQASIANREQMTRDSDVMAAKGNLASAEASAYLAAKKSQYSEAKNALAIVNRINTLALETRLAEKGRSLSQEQKLRTYVSIVRQLQSVSKDFELLGGSPFKIDGSPEPERNRKAADLPPWQAVAPELRCVMSEQNYLDAIQKNVADLKRCADELGKVCPHPAQQKQTADVRKATHDYVDAVTKWASEQKKDAGSSPLDELAKATDQCGASVGKAAADYLKANEAKVQSAADAAFIAAEIVAGLNAAPMHVQGCTSTRDAKHLARLKDLVAQLAKRCDDLRKGSQSPDDQQRAGRVSAAVTEYLAGAQSWAKTAGDAMPDTAPASGCHAIVAAATAFQAAKRAQVDRLADAMLVAAEVADTSRMARLSEKGYLLTREERCWTDLNGHVAKLPQLYEALRATAPGQEEQQWIGRAEKATQEYLAAAKAWFENHRTMLGQIVPNTRRSGETLLAMAQAAENAAWEASDENAVALRGIVMTSKTALIVGLTAGLAAIVLLGTFLAEKATRAIDAVIGETTRISQATARGAMHVRGNPDLVTAEFRPLLDGVNRMLEAVAGSLNAAGQQIAADKKAMACIAEFGKGNFDAPLERLPGKNASLNDCVENVRTHLKNVAREASNLAQAAATGQLGFRADERKCAGAWRQIIQGMNRALDGFEAPVRDLGEVLRRLANKDFSLPAERSYPGTFGKLWNDASLAVRGVRATVERINASALQFAEGCRAIADSSQTLDAGARAQTTSAEEMSASMEELARWVQRVQKNAEQADRVAREASQLAEMGGLAVRKSVDSTRRIRSRSQQMSDMIQVISKTISPTNLLGFNAAVEAARRGDQGAGLAAPRSEAPGLAGPSGQSDRRIAPRSAESSQKPKEDAQPCSSTGDLHSPANRAA